MEKESVGSLSFGVKAKKAQELLPGSTTSDATIVQPKSPGRIESRIRYIKEIAKIKNLQYSLYYSVYTETKEYIHLTTLSIAKAILSKDIDEYAATIVIDGLTKKDTEKVKKDLKSLKIRYDAIRGMKDEQSAFLRLADCMAGFIRDYREKKPYADELFKVLRGKR